MLVLAIDSSTPAISAGLVRVESGSVELVAERVTEDGRAHGELLAPQIGTVLAGVGPLGLAAIVAGLGPGPFTGLRVGLMTAASMGQALGIPVYGVCSLDAIGAGTAGRVLVATDARRKEVYWARYNDGVRVAGPGVDRPTDVNMGGVGAAAGDGALRYADLLGRPTVPPRFPQLLALVELAADRIRSRAPSERLTPLYLRRPDAVEPAARKAVLP